MTLSVSLKNTVIGEGGGILVRYNDAPSQYDWGYANGADIFLTAAITRQSETNEEDLDLAAAGEHIEGIVIGTAFPNKTDLSKDSDSPYSDNTAIRYYKPMERDIFWATVATATSIGKDGYARFSGGFLTTATSATCNCKVLSAITGVSGTEKLSLVEWIKNGA
jgi:hypothetical protein